jgi:hypothetical protein
MNTKDRISFVLLGFVIWAAGTSVYRMAGCTSLKVLVSILAQRDYHRYFVFCCVFGTYEVAAH